MKIFLTVVMLSLFTGCAVSQQDKYIQPVENFSTLEVINDSNSYITEFFRYREPNTCTGRQIIVEHEVENIPIKIEPHAHKNVRLSKGEKHGIFIHIYSYEYKKYCLINTFITPKNDDYALMFKVDSDSCYFTGLNKIDGKLSASWEFEFRDVKQPMIDGWCK